MAVLHALLASTGQALAAIELVQTNAGVARGSTNVSSMFPAAPTVGNLPVAIVGNRTTSHRAPRGDAGGGPVEVG